MTQPIFLISLPRSGSTWVQRQLVAYQCISTLPEPWALLPLAYLQKPEHVLTPYSSFIFDRARTALYEHKIDLNTYYAEALRTAGMRFFEDASRGHDFFLDKTPRYTFILDEMMRAFPDAHYIFLWRSPLDICLSLTHTWGGKLSTLVRYEADFLLGLGNMAKAYANQPAKCLSVRYEDLLGNETKFQMAFADFLNLNDSQRQALRSRDEVEHLIESREIGDQRFKVKPREQVKRMSSMDRHSTKNILNNIPDEFWKLGFYNLELELERLKTINRKMSPISDAVSLLGTVLYKNHMYGAAWQANKQRAKRFGIIPYMLE